MHHKLLQEKNIMTPRTNDSTPSNPDPRTRASDPARAYGRRIDCADAPRQSAAAGRGGRGEGARETRRPANSRYDLD